MAPTRLQFWQLSFLYLMQSSCVSVTHSTIRSYISAVRHLHIINGHGDPLTAALKLDLTLKGIRRVRIHPSHTRLPITPLILRSMQAVLTDQFDHLVLWAASLLGFFGFLRSVEFTVPILDSFDPSSHLSCTDIATDSHLNPTTIRVYIKCSKTDQFHKGFHIYISKADNDLCSVAAMVSYLAHRPFSPGPLFYPEGW